MEIPKMCLNLLEYQRREFMITENDRIDCIKFLEEKLYENTRKITCENILSSGMVDLEKIVQAENLAAS